MKKIIAFIKKFIGEIMLLVGVWVFICNILNFSYETMTKTSGILPKLPSLGGGETINTVAYYYSNGTLGLVALGAILITLSILIIKNKG